MNRAFLPALLFVAACAVAPDRVPLIPDCANPPIQALPGPGTLIVELGAWGDGGFQPLDPTTGRLEVLVNPNAEAERGQAFQVLAAVRVTPTGIMPASDAPCGMTNLSGFEKGVPFVRQGEQWIGGPFLAAGGDDPLAFIDGGRAFPEFLTRVTLPAASGSEPISGEVTQVLRLVNEEGFFANPVP
ncbi:MAG: hypothetical protein Q8N23_27445 [Archangium sp.]|nr:hypothetical protein [Archangium sp.]MDP3156442.1 hypothetical protein [Archangium sp.]MDP3573112.1 hypothetical protein [Archangium sp.]